MRIWRRAPVGRNSFRLRIFGPKVQQSTVGMNSDLQGWGDISGALCVARNDGSMVEDLKNF